MADFLRDPIWQGVGGITAVVALILYILVEKGKFPKLGITFSSIKSFLIVVFLIGLYLFLLGASWLIIVAVGNEFGSIASGIVSELLYGVGVLVAFVAITLNFPGDHKSPILFLKTISVLVLAMLTFRIILYITLQGVQPEEVIFAFWAGVFMGGLTMLIAIGWSSSNKL